jgi:hypothetical protein
MASPVIEFDTSIPGDGVYHFIIAKTGYDTASLSEQKWPPGSDGSGDPILSTSYKLMNIRVRGLAIDCDTPWGLFTPHIEFVVSAPGRPASLTIYKPFGLLDTYAISDKTWQDLQDFLKQAQFPSE